MTLERALSHLRDLLNAGRFDDAMAFISSLEEDQAADRGDIHCMRGSVYDCQGVLRLAEAEYRKASGIAESRLHPEALSRHAYTLKRLNQVPEALQQAQKLVRLYPVSSEGHGLLGELLHDIGRYDEAIPFLESAQNSDPADRRICWALIRSCYFAGSLFEGRAKLYEILGTNEDDWDYLLVLADNLCYAGHFESAWDLFSWYFSERPWDTDIVPSLIYMAMELNELDALESAAKKLLNHNDRPVAAILALAEVAFGRERYEDARELLEELLARTAEDNWAVKSFAAKLALQEGCYPDAYRLATEVLQVRDGFATMCYVAGAAASGMEMDREAIDLIRSYFERNEPESDLMYMLANCEYFLGNFLEACAAAENCFKEDPDDFESRRLYASALHHLGRLEESKQQYDFCLFHDPGDRNSLYGLMFLLDEMGDMDGSKKIADYLVSVGHNTYAQDFQDLIRQNQWQF
jgi:tetratricopeptide (TPR) repeat protein